MKDLYNRKAPLSYWIDRINIDLDGNDRKDGLKFNEIIGNFLLKQTEKT